jgi:hypothetical protein
MLAFRRGTRHRFDPNLAFGQGDKLRLLFELGYSAEPGRHAQLQRTGSCETAGWVEHISLDPALVAVEKDGPLRNRLREQGLSDLIAAATADRPANTYATFNTAWRKIPGHFDFQGPYSALAADVPDGEPIVEVGCWQGRSISYLASELQLRGKTNLVYAVDTWEGSAEQKPDVDRLGGCETLFQTFLTNLVSHRGRVVPLRTESAAASRYFPDESLGAVFLDADHTYEAVSKDLRAWYPKLRPGGLLFGHDYVPPHARSLNGVVRAVDEFFAGQSLEIRPMSRVWKHVKPGQGTRIWS